LVYAKRAYEIEKAKEQLRRNGYDVDLQHNYLTGQLQDGRKVIVPIQEVGLRPYGQ
jgi:biotin operon repressor